jgi:hypothetical protein
MGVAISAGMIELTGPVTLIFPMAGPVEVIKYVPEGPEVIPLGFPPDITGCTNKYGFIATNPAAAAAAPGTSLRSLDTAGVADI